MAKTAIGTTQKLDELYLKAKAMAQDGTEITPAHLRDSLGVTKSGASCLTYMLEQDEYYPALEKLYAKDDLPALVGKSEDTNHFIEFLEDMPPYKKEAFYEEDISERDKAVYVSMGVAVYLSFEQIRQFCIGLYVKCDMALQISNNNLRDAINQKNTLEIKRYFKGKFLLEIRSHLKTMKFTHNEIEAAILLFIAE